MDVITGNRALCLWIKPLQTPINMFGFNNVASQITEYGYLPQFGLTLIFDGLCGTIVSFSAMRERNMFWYYDNSSNIHTLTTGDGFKVCDFYPTNRLYRADYSKISYHPMERENIKTYLRNKIKDGNVPSFLMPAAIAQHESSDSSPVPLTRVPSDNTDQLQTDFNIEEQADDAVKFIPVPAKSPNFESAKEAKSLALLKRWGLARRLKAALGWSTNMKQ
jgi:hypothetical protein